MALPDGVEVEIDPASRSDHPTRDSGLCLRTLDRPRLMEGARHTPIPPRPRDD